MSNSKELGGSVGGNLTRNPDAAFVPDAELLRVAKDGWCIAMNEEAFVCELEKGHEGPHRAFTWNPEDEINWTGDHSRCTAPQSDASVPESRDG